MKLTVAAVLAGSLLPGTLASPPVLGDANPAVWAQSLQESRRSDSSRGSPVPRGLEKRDWSPPSNLASPLKQVWDHCLATYSSGLFGFRNFGWDQLVANNGNINFCVRWDSSRSVSESERAQIEQKYIEEYEKWFEWMYGYDGFPFSKVNVKNVGWAVRDRNLLQGSTEGTTVYTDTDREGIPQCSEACGRFFHQNGDYSGCSNEHYDHGLWLTDGFGGGAGGDWGQRIGTEYFLGTLGGGNAHILLHEMGHTFGLDDFYDWTPSGVPGFIMQAGASTQITDFDGWMLRNWWYELSRNRNWQ